MRLEYVPLLQTQRNLQGLPRDYARFKQYLRTIFQSDDLGMRAPLLAANPMGKQHVTDLLDQYLALDCDKIATDAIRTFEGNFDNVPGDFKIALIVADDLMGGWTNRYANEFEYRFGYGARTSARPEQPALPRWLKHFWLFGVLWTSEPASAETARTALLSTLYRFVYMHRHGSAQTLRDMLLQEGTVMAQANCVGPTLDEDDIEYTRLVLAPYLDATDKRTCMECLFGDEGGRTLGFTPRGLSHWAGLALALHDAKRISPTLQNS